MEIKLLEDFLCLIKVGSFSKAAEARNVTQSAISRRIKALEIWVGVDLINRDTYPVSLTAQGVLFKEVAEDILRQLYNIRDEFQDSWKQSEINFSFTTLDALSISFFPNWLSQLKESTLIPASQLFIKDFKQCIQQIEHGDCDFLLCYAHQWAEVPLDKNIYPSVLLGHERLIPVCMNDESLQAPKYSWPGTQDKPIPFLSYSQGNFLGQVVDAIWQRLNESCSIKTVYENSTATSLKAMAEHGYGMAWVPERVVDKEVRNKQLSVMAEFDWIPELEIRLYKAPNRKRVSIEKFWDYIQSEYGDASPEHSSNIALSCQDMKQAAAELVC